MAGSLLWSRQTPWTASSTSMRPTRFACRRLHAIACRWQVTDITYIKTHEGWLYLSVVIDLFSRRVVGWSAQPRMTTDLALQALLAAVWRRKPKAKVMIHSDQGSQCTSREWQLFLSQHNLEASMSRRGNCHDNAVAESFFQLLKRERIRRRIYLTREAARQDVFDYIEMFYNPKRKHTNNGMLSPVDFEVRQQKLNEAGVWGQDPLNLRLRHDSASARRPINEQPLLADGGADGPFGAVFSQEPRQASRR